MTDGQAVRLRLLEPMAVADKKMCIRDRFMDAAEQFERIMNVSGFVRLRRLSTDEIVGTEKSAGLIERYFSLMPEGDVYKRQPFVPRQDRASRRTANSFV